MLRELLNIRKDPAVKLDRILKSSIVLALVVSLCVLLLVPSVVFAQDNLTEESINPDSLGVSSDNAQVAAFVTRFYQECLSRDPDTAGLNGWVNWLVTGAKTGADVAYGFVFSQEFQSKTLTNTQYLTILYKAFFNRSPDTQGLNNWLNHLNSGKSRQWVLAGFINSQEFKNLCATYGINPGSIDISAIDPLYYLIGQSIRFRGVYWDDDSRLSGVVTRAEFKTQLTDYLGDTYHPGGIFLVVLMNVTNYGLQSDYVSDYSFKIKDSQGRKFDIADLEPQWAAEDEYDRKGVYEAIQPGFTEPLVFVFDVLSTSMGFQLDPISSW